jgi:transposase-like protein
VEEGDLIKYGRSRRGVQRYHCKSCESTFTATRGTLFQRKRTPLKDILETLALLAEGVRISSAASATNSASKPTCERAETKSRARLRSWL